jgi:hypothetical protein
MGLAIMTGCDLHLSPTFPVIEAFLMHNADNADVIIILWNHRCPRKSELPDHALATDFCEICKRSSHSDIQQDCFHIPARDRPNKLIIPYRPSTLARIPLPLASDEGPPGVPISQLQGSGRRVARDVEKLLRIHRPPTKISHDRSRRPMKGYSRCPRIVRLVLVVGTAEPRAQLSVRISLALLALGTEPLQRRSVLKYNSVIA